MMLPWCLDVTRRMVSAVLFYLLGAWILLTEVSGQSQWIAKPADRSVSLGSNASFTCKPNIVNDTQIVWTKETTVLFVNGMRFSGVTSRYTLSDPYTLFITNVLPLDNGQFGCNAVDSGTVSAQLTVLLPPGQPSISSSLIGDIFREGQVVDFNCTTTGGNPHPTINWMKNGVDLLNSQTTQASTVGGLSWSIVTVTMDHSDHRANYTCFVHNIVNENNPLSVSRILAVQYSPIITFNPYGIYNVRQGQMANLTCLVDANPIVSTVTWLKNGASLDGTGLSRVFSSVTREDAGNYTCIASNIINSNNPTRNTTYINVVYPPIVSLPASMTVLQGKNVSVVCKVDANPSPYQIQWYLPDGTHAPSATEVLTILQVTVKDAGNYSCRANSQLRVSGGSQQGEIVYGESFMYLYVQYPPGIASLSDVTNINVGERLQIHCTAIPAGYPTASFRWRKNGTDQSQINGTFIIPSTTLLDNGVYSCTPYNSVGEGVPDTVTINVNEPPSLLVGLPEEQTLLINNENPLTLTCKGQGRPQPTIEWFKGNEMENLLSSNMSLYYSISNASTTKNTYSFEVTSTLYFKGPGRERTLGSEQTKLLIQDLGTYTCRVRSPVHTSAPNSTMQLWVQFKPVLLQNSEKMAVLNSEEVNLVCEAQAYPNPNFTWYRRSSQRITPSMKYNLQQEIVNKMPSAYRSVLTIMEVQVDDYGMYSCEVSNFLGKVTQLINITTKSSPEAPNALQTMDRTWESVFLQWIPGFDGGYPQTFWVQIRQAGSPSLKIEQVQPESSTFYNITGLKPSTRYEFSVFGRNHLGDGQSSSIILSQTRDLEIPTLGDSSVIFNTETNKLVITNLPGSQYCLKIEAAQADGRWKVLKPCTILFSGESMDLVEKNIVAVNVSVCLLNRMEVCSAPMAALIFSPPNSPALTERDVIIIACVCAVIIITLLIVLICFICRRRQASAKQFENEDGAHQPTTNGGMPGKKPQQQGYDNTGMVLEDLPDSRGHGPSTGNSSLPLSAQNVHAKNTNSSVYGRHVGLPSSDRPPNYWDLSPQHHSNRNDTSYDSDRERQIIENEMNSNNEPMYGRADGYHGRADLQQNMHSGMRSPTKDKYIDLEERKDPSNMSHESGYSTGDPSKPKKTQPFSWRPGSLLGHSRFLSRIRKRKTSQSSQRFSHSPPGHTCGLPCCSDDIHIHVKLGTPNQRYGCMPVSTKQADVEHNFTFRRSRLISGKPSLASKFFSLQSQGSGQGKVRFALPRYRDDSEIAGPSGKGDRSLKKSATIAARGAARQSRVSIESDTDSDYRDPQPEQQAGEVALRTPLRHLQSWECFRKREISLPDVPGTPHKMVFLDYRPEESRDDAEATEDERPKGEEAGTIEIYASGSNLPFSLQTPQSSQTRLPVQTASIQVVRKSALKKSDGNSDQNRSSCSFQGQTQDQIPAGQGRKPHFENNDANFQNQGASSTKDFPFSGMQVGPPASVDYSGDGDTLSSGHVYDEVCDIRLNRGNPVEGREVREHKAHVGSKGPELPPFPPSLKRCKSKPDLGRKAVTPEMKRKPLPSRSKQDNVAEERYSTFPIRKHSHPNNKLPKSHLGRSVSVSLNMSNKQLLSDILDLLTINDVGSFLRSDDVTEEALYEPLGQIRRLSDIEGCEGKCHSSKDRLEKFDSGRLLTGSDRSERGVASGRADVVSTRGEGVSASSADIRSNHGDEMLGDLNFKEERKVGHIEFASDSPITLIL